MQLRNGKIIQTKVISGSSVMGSAPSVMDFAPVLYAPKKTPESRHFTPAFLGEGTYGKVYKISDTTIRKDCSIFDEDDENEIAGENFLEAMFLKSFDAPFIPSASRIKANLKADKLSIFERYGGETLSVAARRLSYAARVKLLPTIMCQMGRILMWMKRHHVAHMDIKPGNICIDSNNNLTLIDWGFVGIVGKTEATYTGTEVFADPAYLVKDTPPISHEYDMFGMGMTIWSFIFKTYPELDEWKEILNIDEKARQNYLWYLLDINEELYKDFEDFLPGTGTQMLELLLKMLDLNPEKRLRPAALYTSPLFRDLWEKYPIHTGDNHLPHHYGLSEKFSKFLKTREYENLFFLFSPNINNLATRFFRSFSSRPESAAHDPEGIFVICLYIADIIIQENYDFESLPQLSHQFSKKVFLEDLIEVLEILDWKCFDSDFITLPKNFIACHYQ